MIQLETQWSNTVNKDHVWEEYPRPNMVRDSYVNLNGEWDCCINRENTTDFYDKKFWFLFLRRPNYQEYSKLFSQRNFFITEDILPCRRDL